VIKNHFESTFENRFLTLK